MIENKRERYSIDFTLKQMKKKEFFGKTRMIGIISISLTIILLFGCIFVEAWDIELIVSQEQYNYDEYVDDANECIAQEIGSTIAQQITYIDQFKIYIRTLTWGNVCGWLGLSETLTTNRASWFWEETIRDDFDGDVFWWGTFDVQQSVDLDNLFIIFKLEEWGGYNDEFHWALICDDVYPNGGWRYYDPITNNWYYDVVDFTFKIFGEVVNYPPNTPSSPSPSNGATGVSLSPSLSVLVSDPNNDPMTVKFYSGSGSLISTKNNVASGTRPSVTWSGLSYSTTYNWYVTADDGVNPAVRGPSSGTWSFTTIPEPDPQLAYSPNNIDFGYIAKGGTDSDTFNIWNSGGKTLNWQVTSNNNWIGRNPSSGTNSGTVTVSLQNTNSLTRGSHGGSLSITSTNGGSGTVNVDVDIVESASVTTQDVTDISRTADLGAGNIYVVNPSATLSGTISDDGGQPCQIRFRYRETGTGTWHEFGTWQGSFQTGQSFTVDIHGANILDEGTQYDVQAGVKNAAGTIWGNTVTFHTNTHEVLVVPTIYNGQAHFTAAQLTQIQNNVNQVIDYYLDQSFDEMRIGFDFYQQYSPNVDYQLTGVAGNYPNTQAGLTTYGGEMLNGILGDLNEQGLCYDSILTIRRHPGGWRASAYVGTAYTITITHTSGVQTQHNTGMIFCDLTDEWQTNAHESGHSLCRFLDYYYEDRTGDAINDNRGDIRMWGLMGAGNYMHTINVPGHTIDPAPAPIFCFNKVEGANDNDDPDWLDWDIRAPPTGTNQIIVTLTDYEQLNLNGDILRINTQHTVGTKSVPINFYFEARDYGHPCAFNDNAGNPIVEGGIVIYQHDFSQNAVDGHIDFIQNLNTANGDITITFGGRQWSISPTIRDHGGNSKSTYIANVQTPLEFTYLGDNTNNGIFDPRIRIEVANLGGGAPTGRQNGYANTTGVILKPGGGDINIFNGSYFDYNGSYIDFDLHAYTTSGLHIGINYTTGEYEEQIPNCITTGPSFWDEQILVPKGVEVNFKVCCNSNLSSSTAYNYVTQLVDMGPNPSVNILPDGNFEYIGYTISEPVLRNLTIGDCTGDLDEDGIPFYQEILSGTNPNEGDVFSTQLNITFDPEIYVLPVLGGSFDLIVNVAGGQIPVINADLTFSSSDPDVTISSVQELGNGQYKVTVSVSGWLGWGYSETITTSASKYGFINGSGEMMITTDIPPEAKFSFTPEEPTDIEDVYFTDKSTDADGYITDWLWDFGDGYTSTERNPIHQFDDDGIYSVVLTVWDDYGVPGSLTKSIEVFNVPPVADANGPYYGFPNIPLTLDGSGSSDVDGTIVAYNWDLDNDGQYDDISGMNPSTVWSVSGLHYISLRVTDDDGAIDTNDTKVYINAPPEFGDPTPANGSIGQPVEYLRWSIPISDLEGDLFDWSIECSNGQKRTRIDETNGTKLMTLGGLEYNTEYIVWVNATDPEGSGLTTREYFTFTTADGPPSIVYVDDDYTYSTPGFGIDKFIFIQHGVNHVQTYGTVEVADGIYDEPSNILINKDGIDVQGPNVPSFDSSGAIVEDTVIIKANGVSFSGFILKSSEYIPALIVDNTADASTITIQYNKFLKDCISGAIGLENKDTNILDARYNYWGTCNGPSGNIIDAITGRLADGYGVEIIDNGPVWFDHWAGLDAKAIVDTTAAEQGTPIIFDASNSFAAHMDGTPIDYSVLWDFDDGAYSTDLNPIHVFDTSGIYHVTLRVDAVDTNLYNGVMYSWDNLTINIFTPGTSLSCSADGENLGGYSGLINTLIQFYGSAIGGKPPYTYNWDFGDETSNIEGQNPTHKYIEAGTYTVELTVIDSNNDVATDTVQVVIDEIEPLTATVTASKTVVEIGESILFTSSATGGLKPYEFIWDFGDSSSYVNSKNPEYIFEEEGTYLVTLTVTDFEGSSDTDTLEIIVGEGEEIEEVEIKEVKAGFGVKATINAGSSGCHWEIDVEGMVFFGGKNSGTIYANTQETARLGFSLALGNVDIIVKADDLEKQYTAFALGPLFLNLKEV